MATLRQQRTEEIAGLFHAYGLMLQAIHEPGDWRLLVDREHSDNVRAIMRQMFEHEGFEINVDEPLRKLSIRWPANRT